MILSAAVLLKVVLALEPLCAFDAVELAEPGQVLGGLGGRVLLEVMGGSEIGVDLVEISGTMRSAGGRRGE